MKGPCLCGDTACPVCGVPAVCGITQEQFESYEEVRVSGVTNMWDTRTVSTLSGLTQDECMTIMKNYSALHDAFGES